MAAKMLALRGCQQARGVISNSNGENQSVVCYERSQINEMYVPLRIRPLMYMTVLINSKEILALIDTGSEINLVHEKMLTRCLYQPIIAPADTIGGLGESTLKIQQWVSIKLDFENGNDFSIIAAVVSPLTCGFLLGLPFLCDIEAIIDCRKNLLYSKVIGDVKLQKKPPRNKGNNQVLHVYMTELKNIQRVINQTIEEDSNHREKDIEDKGEESENNSMNKVAVEKFESEAGSLNDGLSEVTTSIKLIEERMSKSAMNLEQQGLVKSLLIRFLPLWKNKVRGMIKEIHHHIRLSTVQPIVTRARYHAEEQQKIIQEELNKMIEAKAVQVSCSQYSSEVVMVLKKTGDWRFCVDFRPLNAVTVEDKYPLPLIRDLLQQVRQSNWFVALDLRSGYWQIPMAEDSRHYTAFRCNSGLYEFLVMPFGLKNAPSTFQRAMDFLFNDLKNKGMSVYLDDILIHGKTFQECYRLTELILTRLKEVNLTINLEKSQFFYNELRYLGHIVGQGQLQPEESRVLALRKLKTPQTITDVRSLLGLIGYYQMYIKDFAKLSKSIYELLQNTPNSRRKNQTTKIEWTDRQDKDKNELIDQLTDSILKIPMDGEEFLLETDASDEIIGAVLSVIREEKKVPIEFFSKILTKTEQKWPTREKEAFAIVKSVQKFDRFIRGRSVTVNSDHESLQWIFEAKKGKIARWALMLAEYSLKVNYIKGKDNIIADFLTRHIDAEPDLIEDRMTCFCTSVFVDKIELPTMEEIMEAQEKELETCLLLKLKGYSLEDGLIHYHSLVYIPIALRGKVIRACHSMFPVNHPGQKKTTRLINKLFNWPDLYGDVRRYIGACLICQRCRIGKEKKQGLFRIHTMKEIMQKVHMDYYLVTYKGKEMRYLTLIDQFSKWAECIEVTKKATGKNVAAIFLESWIFRFGLPTLLVSDNDSTFCNETIKETMKILRIRHIFSTPYHPEGNATIEVFHRTINRGLRNFHGKSVDVDEAMKYILFAYRVTPHALTGNSPFYMLYGYDPTLSPEIDWRFASHISEQNRLRYLSLIRLEVQLKAQALLLQQNKKSNQRRQLFQFEIGQLVLYNLPSSQRHTFIVTSEKAYPIWSLPQRVIRVKNESVAVVQDLITKREREVHSTQCRILEIPKFEEQHEEWVQALAVEALSFFDEDTAKQLIHDFFKKIVVPKLVEEDRIDIISPLPRKKRERRPQQTSALAINLCKILDQQIEVLPDVFAKGEFL